MSEESYDVIVVGAGVGGCAAATEAASLGGQVLLLEVTDQVGGNAVRSTGYLAMADTPMQRDAGLRDSADVFLADIEAEIERQQRNFPVHFNRELAQRFAEESSGTYDYLRAIGVRWSRFVKRPTLHSVDRMAATVDTQAFRTGFEQLIADTGVQVRTGQRAIELIRNGGVVSGVRVHDIESGTTREIRSTRGVVLATGSYSANGSLRERHQLKQHAWTPYLGLETTRGDGHVMAAALGADLVSMSMIPLFVVVPGAILEDCIAVNGEGLRFHDENGPYDDRVSAVMDQPGGIAHYIFDHATATVKQKYIREFPAEVFVANSLPELAGLIGCSVNGLVETVASWNIDRRNGAPDTGFGRLVFSPDNREISEPPYYASRLVVGITFPSGGVRVTENLEAVDVLGRTMPGLYAVGDCAGGLSSAIGLGGLRITPAITLGRIAGREVMKSGAPQPTRLVADELMNGPAVVREDRGTTMVLHD